MRLDRSDRLLLRTIRDGWTWNVPLVLLSLGTAGGSLLVPALLAATIDTQLAGTGGPALLWFAGVLTALLAAELALQLLSPWCTNTVTMGLRRTFLARVLHLPPRDQDRFSPGDVTARLMTSSSEAASVVPLVAGWVSSTTVCVGALVALALIDVWSALTFLAGVPIAILLIRTFLGRITPLLTRQQAVQGRISGRLVEVLSGIRTVRAAGTEAHEADRVLRDLPELHDVGRRIWSEQGSVNLRASLLMPVMQVAVLTAAGFALLAGRITPGELMAVSAYTSMALGLFGQAGVLMAVSQARAGARRVTEVTALPALPQGDRTLPAGPGELLLRQVSVEGDGRRLLDRVDLRVPGGTTVAVVGDSGSGKSLLAQVAGRLCAPDSGTVLLDGVPLADLSLDALGRAVGWAFERPSYLGRSFRDALRLADPGMSEEHMVRAAREAEADHVISALPEGYATPPHDAPLSGGEQQRVGLARALAHPGRLLILDDATSSLDSVTEQRIGRVLTGAGHGATRLVLTHRLATAARADAVVWLERGRVRGHAPHADLWHDADYRAVFRPGEPPRHKEPELSRAR